MTDIKKYAYEPTPEIIAQSNLTAFLKSVDLPNYAALVKKGDADPGWLMEEVFRFCDMRFYKPYTQILDLSRGIAWARWCIGGTTNMVLNLIDKHRDTPAWDRPFMVWEGEDPEEQRSLTYREMDAEVCRLAAGLKSLGVGKGDVVGIYMPTLLETYVAFFSILKLGAILLPLFSGFGARPIITRLNDGGAKVVITADGTWRRGTAQSMKPVLDEALTEVPGIEHVIVVRRMGDKLSTPMQAGRDWWWADVVAGQPSSFPTEQMEAEAPAGLLYTSGTTGRPKGCVWTHVGFLGTMVTRDIHILCDFKATDRYLWMSDMGWMLGSMAACVPGMFGASALIVEGAPDYPDPGRFWRLVQNHKVTWLGVTPTLIRGMMSHGDSEVESYDLSSVRMTCSAGEASTEAAWRWCFKHVCKSKIPICNITGGTEVGGVILTTTLHHPLNPGSFAGPVPGMGADIVDEHGRSVPIGQVGELVLRQASIGMTKSLWNDDQRYLDTYWNTIPGIWVHGDFAMRGEDGLYYVLGRSDDTIKMSGKRTGPAEIESLLVATGKVSEAAVIGVPDPIKGSAIVCVCVAMPHVTVDSALVGELSRAVVAGMGTSYRPKQIEFISAVPKTRSLKVMRRVIRAVFQGSSPGDISSLVNPEVVDELRAKLEASGHTAINT